MARRPRLDRFGRLLGVGVFCAALLAAVVTLAATRRRVRPADARAAAPAFVIPSIREPIAIDGELSERAWLDDAAKTGPFLDEQSRPGVPHSHARLAWRGDLLYVAMYAADVDIEARDLPNDTLLGDDDAFHLELQRGGDTYAIEVSAKGVVTDGVCAKSATCELALADRSWQSGAKVALDADGSLNDPTDRDEEWVVEMQVPLGSLGLADAKEPFLLQLRRCDRPRDGRLHCATWEGGRARSYAVLGP